VPSAAVRPALCRAQNSSIEVISLRTLTLPASLATSLASGHPWVYRDHVGGFTAADGTWLRVVAGSYEAIGLWDAESPIAVRLFSTRGPVDARFVAERVREAWELRALVRGQGVTGYRLLFGEADGLPGIVVDLYGDYAVLVTYSRSLGALVPEVAQAVEEVARVRGVVRRARDGDGVRLTLLAGEPPPSEVIIEERGMRLLAELEHGQKTGLFFDHRDNRAFVREISAGRSVLNLFAYTGGFSVAAALGGARAVTSVDISPPAIAAAQRNFALNGLEGARHEALVADVFEYLEAVKARGERFDLVVCDPPSFAKNRQQLRAAEKAYRRLLALCLEVTVTGGLLCAASCTSQVSPDGFRAALRDAARKARRRLQVVRDIGHAPDHPVSIGHEEGRYLKFVAGRVLERC
jgi:23S rRNA (cytosine1962-C5)-methyltransferase